MRFVVTNLLVDNLHLEEQIILVRGKGNKERIVPFGGKAKEKLLKYLTEVRPQFVKGRTVPEVFVNYKGEKLSRQGIWKRFRELEINSGVQSKIHTLRHSFASILLKNGANIRVIQELLGHEDLKTTQIYTHLINEKLKKDYEDYHPRSCKDRA